MAISTFTANPPATPQTCAIKKPIAYGVPVAQTPNASTPVPSTGQQIPPQQRIN